MAAKLAIETVGGFGRASDHDDSRDGGIEPADDPKIDIPRLIVSLGDVLFRAGQKSLLPGGKSHRRQAHRFIDNQQVVVFVKNIEIRLHGALCRRVITPPRSFRNYSRFENTRQRVVPVPGDAPALFP